MVQEYVSVPVPPETVAEKDTELPTSVGFCELDMLTEGLSLIETVTVALLVTPTLSVMVTVRV
jgi:hypothetical protein